MTSSFMVEAMAIANAVLRQKDQDEESEVNVHTMFFSLLIKLRGGGYF